MRCAQLIGESRASDTELCDMPLGSLLTPAIVTYLECVEVQSIHHDQFTNARKVGNCSNKVDVKVILSVLDSFQ